MVGELGRRECHELPQTHAEALEIKKTDVKKGKKKIFTAHMQHCTCRAHDLVF